MLRMLSASAQMGARGSCSPAFALLQRPVLHHKPSFSRTFSTPSKDRHDTPDLAAEELRKQEPADTAPPRQGLDPRVWRIAASSLMMGTGIGIVLPVMPVFATQLGLSSSQYGIVISVMGATRLLFNIPASFAADKFGRLPLLVGGPALSSICMAATSTADSMSHLASYRFGVGAGGSCQMAGAHAYLSDISCPENRARTMAPLMTSFSAGAALGPALGGLIADQFGIRAPFLVVGAAIAGVAINNSFLPETLPKKAPTPSEKKGFRGLLSDFKKTASQWKPLMRSKDMQCVLLVHTSYWFASSGAIMTLMPLIAFNNFGLSPGSLGGYFALMAICQVVGTQPAAWVSDKFGRKKNIVPAMGVLALSCVLLPWTTSTTAFTALLFSWSLGATTLGTTPTAYVADINSTETRNQALALLRSAGDIGLMFGAGLLGLVAHMTDPAVAMGLAGTLLLTSGSLFALRATEVRGKGATKPPSQPK